MRGIFQTSPALSGSVAWVLPSDTPSPPVVMNVDISPARYDPHELNP